MANNAENKRFEEWEDVSCNECVHYWDSSCDGVPVDKRRNCTAYKASRTVSIPAEIESLNKRVKCLSICLAIVGAALLLFEIAYLIGG